MITLDQLNLDALYVPGLTFRRQGNERRQGVVVQNTRGAVEVWHALREPATGGVIAHLPQQREGYQHAAECTVLLGTCWSRETHRGYSFDFLPLLLAGHAKAALQQLADWHDQVFALRAVTA
ncbi:hypothetical protein VA596_41445 [Amycolatopsis sp., V23-08]|uniref:Uncharacterized protein n=1 Tax=Amycolatopsis heterodermiae TaxID=3110235 RepID=A0ABU5RIG0_9PSEU|nr:hypothetical protein [Amycolatopsis sp., V23-08]MEA5366052.1 hypothetical protein [Amycolatopsis sp., V23-08]